MGYSYTTYTTRNLARTSVWAHRLTGSAVQGKGPRQMPLFGKKVKGTATPAAVESTDSVPENSHDLWAEDGLDDDPGSTLAEEWTIASWLHSLDLHKVIAAAST